MREIRIEKVTLNIGAGEGGEKLEKVKVVLERLSGRKAVITKTHKRTTFAARKKPIGVKVTLRNKPAIDLLKRLTKAVELRKSSFDDSGNFSFGIAEYIDIPQMEYDPKIGMFGLDVCVTLERPGFRVKRKRIPTKIGKKHKITREEAMDFAKKFGFNLEAEE